MDISAASISDMYLSQTMQTVNMAMLKKTMENQEAQVAALINSIPQQPVQSAPSFGHLLDTYA